MKRVIVIVAALTAALIAAGCGSTSSGGATGDALSFMPKDAPVVATVDTDPNGDQWKQVNKLLAKFPFAGQVKAQAKQGFNQSSKLDFDKDVKPLLGNDLVFIVPTVQALRANNTPVVFALKAKDQGKASDFIKNDANKVSSFEGTDIYKELGNTYLALKDGVLVFAQSAPDLQAALKRHGGSDHMTQADLDTRLAGLSGDALLKAGVNVEQVIAQSPDPSARQARKIPWVGALRTVGVSFAAKPDGFDEQFKATTEGSLSPEQLPLASGSQSAPVVRRANDIGFGLRNLAQTIKFGEAAMQATDPKGYATYRQRKQRLGKVLGINLDRDVISQFQGDASLSVGLDGGFAVRSSLRDPAAFRATLKKAAPKLTKAAKGEHVGVAVPSKPNGFSALATASGKKYVFAVIGDKFVLATDAARAGQFAAQSAAPVPGAKGSLVMAMDTRSIANQIAQKQGQSAAAGLLTAALGDFIGSVESEASGLTGSFKLNIK
jgi:hypothetical protein